MARKEQPGRSSNRRGPSRDTGRGPSRGPGRPAGEGRRRQRSEGARPADGERTPRGGSERSGAAPRPAERREPEGRGEERERGRSTRREARDLLHDVRAPNVDLLAGRNSVREALLAGRRRIYRLAVAEGAREAGTLEEILTLAAERQIPVQRIPRADLDTIADALAHQGVVAQASPYPYAEIDEVLALAKTRGEDPLVLVLDSLEDPQNVGSLVRTAEAVGAHGIVVPRHRAAPITAAVSRASAGAVEHLLVAEVTNLARALELLKERGVWVVGIEDEAAAQDYRTIDLAMPLALVVGSEGSGMHRLVRERCDLLARLPMRGQIGSLNVSAAGAVMLYRALEAREAAR